MGRDDSREAIFGVKKEQAVNGGSQGQRLPWPIRMPAIRRRRRSLFGFVGERDFGFFVEDERAHKTV